MFLTGMMVQVGASVSPTNLTNGAPIPDRGTWEPAVWAGRPIYTMSREFELLAGRPYDSPGCAASANP